MIQHSNVKLALRIGLVLAACGAGAGAHANTITAWSFENNSIGVNNSPAASTGTGTASSLGMTNNYPTTATDSVTTDDVLQGVTTGSKSDTGTNGVADGTQIWRIRGQDASGKANGWSSQAAIGTQGAQFAASTTGYQGINVSFDWYTTNQGEANLEFEYTTNGTTWINAALTPSGSDAGLTVKTNSTSANTVMGSYVNAGTAGQEWFTDLTATITNPSAANDPNFAIRMVNASTGVDDLSAKGTALNNSSGDWRFDNVSVSGTAITPVPMPASAWLMIFGLGGLGTLVRKRKAV